MFDLNRKILIVDDMAMIRAMVRKVLIEIGFQSIDEAENGAVAWGKITNNPIPYAFIISDWNMPDSTGLDLLKRIRSSNEHKTIPFILLTSKSEQNQIVEAIKAEVSDYIIKPINASTLLKKLELLHKKSMR